jgi:hypothetical protein
MPIQRRNVANVDASLPEFQDRFQTRVRPRTVIPGYLFGDPNGSKWQGYINIGSDKFQIEGELGTRTTGDEYLEISFHDERWDTMQRNQFLRSGFKTFRGYLTYPSWVRMAVDHPGNTYSFNFKAQRFGQGQHAVWSITERPRPRQPS